MIPIGVKTRCVRWTFKAMGSLGVRSVNYRLAYGGKMLLHTNDSFAQRVRCEESFEPDVRREMERVLRHRTHVIDIGANIGYYSIMAARLIGRENRVFSFEPQAPVADKLRRNLELNQLQNVVVFPFALSDTAGELSFCVPREGEEAFGSMHANGRFDVVKTVEVAAHRLDDVLARLGDPEIGLVKIDAEGAELPILRGSTRLLSSPKKPVLIFEANETNCRPFGYCVFDLLEYVHGFGYRLRQLDSEDWIAEPQSQTSVDSVPGSDILDRSTQDTAYCKGIDLASAGGRKEHG